MRSIPYLSAIILFAWVNLASGDTRIALGPSSGTAGNSSDFILQFNTNERIAGIQLDLTFSGNEVTLGDPIVGSAGRDGFEVDFNLVSAGRMRLVLVSPSGGLLLDGELLRIPLSFLQTVPGTRRAVSLGGVILSTEYGLGATYQLSPFIQIIQPIDGGEFDVGQSLMIEAVSFGVDAPVRTVELLVNGARVQLDATAPYTASWVALEPGVVLVSGVAVDTKGNRVQSPSVPVTIRGEPLRSFEAWASYFFKENANNPLVSGPDVDWDGDGELNAFEYLQGTDPTNSESRGGWPKVSFREQGGEKYLAVEIRKRLNVTDVQLEVHGSGELRFGEGVPGRSVSTPVENIPGGEFEVVTYIDTVPVSQSDVRFLRVQVGIDK